MDKELYLIHAEMCKVFSNPGRLEILNTLRHGERSVTELTKRTKLSQASVSQHLAVMRLKGIVKARRHGNRTYYRLMNPKIIRAFDIIREILRERIAVRRA